MWAQRSWWKTPTSDLSAQRMGLVAQSHLMGRCQNIHGKSSGLGTQKICFSFVSLSRLHLVCLFWVVFIWFLLGLTFYSHRFAFASSSVWTGLHLREWILARGLRQCSLLVCLSWGKERAEVNILQLDLWEGIKLPWSLWRELTGFSWIMLVDWE